MSLGVQFDDQQDLGEIPEPELKPPTMGDTLLKSGVLANPGDLSIMLGIFAVLLLVGSFYLLASSIPPPPELGSDVLRPGERVPEYVQ